MGFYSHFFRSKNLPPSVWDSGVLYLPESLAAAHKELLVSNGWMNNYLPNQQGGVGGKSTEDAQDHFINRFLNSAARMQFVCSAPDDKQPEVREMVFDQLGDGHVFLLDLAAGNGAGTLAMLSLLCELRFQKAIPTLPVNVTILGIDFSKDALGFYTEMLDKLKPWLATAGIKLDLKTEVCDLTVSGSFNEVLESFFDEANHIRVNRFLCVISALSGVGKEGFEQMHDSLKMAAARLSYSKRNSSWLWVEPYSNKAWLQQFIDTIKLVLSKVPFFFSKKADGYEIKSEAPLLPCLEKRKFDWHDPHMLKIAKSHVVVMAFKNE